MRCSSSDACACGMTKVGGELDRGGQNRVAGVDDTRPAAPRPVHRAEHRARGSTAMARERSGARVASPILIVGTAGSDRGRPGPIPAIGVAGFEHHHLGDGSVAAIDTVLPTAREGDEKQQAEMQHDGQKCRHDLQWPPRFETLETRHRIPRLRPNRGAFGGAYPSVCAHASGLPQRDSRPIPDAWRAPCGAANRSRTRRAIAREIAFLGLRRKIASMNAIPKSSSPGTSRSDAADRAMACFCLAWAGPDYDGRSKARRRSR